VFGLLSLSPSPPTEAISLAFWVRFSAATACKQITRTEDTTESYKRLKVEFLHRHIMDYQQIFRDIATLSGDDSYLFLDDLYQLGRPDQPSVIDYFHRIAKDN
jgi:hypothetical protein